jgi:hypothetical protein
MEMTSPPSCKVRSAISSSRSGTAREAAPQSQHSKRGTDPGRGSADLGGDLLLLLLGPAEDHRSGKVPGPGHGAGVRVGSEAAGAVTMPVQLKDAPLQVAGLQDVPAAERLARDGIAGPGGEHGGAPGSHREQPGVPPVSDRDPVIGRALQCGEQRPDVRAHCRHGTLAWPVWQRHEFKQPEFAVDEDGKLRNFLARRD